MRQRPWCRLRIPRCSCRSRRDGAGAAAPTPCAVRGGCGGTWDLLRGDARWSPLRECLARQADDDRGDTEDKECRQETEPERPGDVHRRALCPGLGGVEEVG